MKQIFVVVKLRKSVGRVILWLLYKQITLSLSRITAFLLYFVEACECARNIFVELYSKILKKLDCLYCLTSTEFVQMPHIAVPCLLLEAWLLIERPETFSKFMKARFIVFIIKEACWTIFSVTLIIYETQQDVFLKNKTQD